MSFRERERILERPFIYRERQSLEEFYSESEVWSYLYQLYEKFKTVFRTHIFVSPLRLFNEARYQSVRLFNDSNPNHDFDKRYYEVAVRDLGDEFNADTCFLLVFYILNSTSPDREEMFCKYKKLLELCENMNYAREYFHLSPFQTDNDFYVNFSYETETPDEMINSNINYLMLLSDYSDSDAFTMYSSAWWNRVTDRFSINRVIEIIEYWHSPKDRFRLAKMILQAFQTRCKDNNAELLAKDDAMKRVFMHYESLYLDEKIRKNTGAV